MPTPQEFQLFNFYSIAVDGMIWTVFFLLLSMIRFNPFNCSNFSRRSLYFGTIMNLVITHPNVLFLQEQLDISYEQIQTLETALTDQASVLQGYYKRIRSQDAMILDLQQQVYSSEQETISLQAEVLLLHQEKRDY